MENIKLFGEIKVRSHYDSDKEIWYFSIVDIVGILTDQPSIERARNYLKVLKNRLLKEGNETITNCNQLRLHWPNYRPAKSLKQIMQKGYIKMQLLVKKVEKFLKMPERLWSKKQVKKL